MQNGRIRIAVVAPASRLPPQTAEQVLALARRLYGDQAPEIVFHPQCFATSGHFAGDDALRSQALVEVANDATFDAVWFARGGYGSNRVAEAAIARMGPAARAKAWLGYSDIGFLLAGFYRAGFPHVAHGPVAQDIRREGGEAAAARALAWLTTREAAALEPSLEPGVKAAAFNITVLSQLLGTGLEPDLSGHVLMLEEVSEAMYRIDRALFHITSQPAIRRVAGLRLGRCSAISLNDPDFGLDEVAVAKLWCERSGIPWLGRADIGHDAGNRVVPFGGL
ncbi:MAG: LD-carboxypeptidase [Caulobacteraceae bacterium]|nr:LD-carboxypeptidase [Caulobacteraceae bacterium]